MAAAAILAQGCAAPPSAPTPLRGPTATTTAEWHDVDAAVSFAAAAHEMAVMTRRDLGGSLEYQLVTIIDEPVWLRVVRSDAEGTPADIATPLALTAQIGRFGNEERERAFIRTITVRLDRLIEVD